MSMIQRGVRCTVVTVALACQPVPASKDTNGGATDDTGEPAMCTFPVDATFQPAMPTFVDLAWSGPPGATFTVLAESPPLPTRTYAPEQPDHATIPFLDADRTWLLTVHAEAPEGSCDSAPVALTLPAPPAGLPALLGDIPPDEATLPLVALTIGGVQPAAALVNPFGGYTWWIIGDGGFYLDRARLSGDGTGVWTLRRSPNPESVSLLRHTTWRDGTDETLQLFGAHDDFVEIDADGDRLAWLVADHREVDGVPIVGDAVHVLDASGVERTLWSTFDTFPVVLNDGWTTTAYEGEADWTHAVSLRYEADADLLLVALRNVPCVVALRRSTGQVAWVLGDTPGRGGDLAYLGAAPLHPRSPSLTESGILLFDNGDDATLIGRRA
jgi:hypothetical protein